MDQAERLRNIVKKQNKKGHLARVITVTSGKGGVGKSNVSVNLAIQLSRLNKRVVILDADFGLANVEIMLGIRPKYNLSDLIFRGMALEDVVSAGPENIGFISGGSGLRELTNLNKDQIQNLVRMMYELDHIADIVIIDTGAGISSSVIDLILASSEVLLVATPEPTSITDAYALLKTLCRYEEFYENSIRIKMIANRTHSYYEGEELFSKLDTVVKKFLKVNMEYLGYIPYDEKLQKAVMRQQPVTISYPNAVSTRAMLEIALFLESGSEVSVGRKSRGLSGVITKMFRYGR